MTTSGAHWRIGDQVQQRNRDSAALFCRWRCERGSRFTQGWFRPLQPAFSGHSLVIPDMFIYFRSNCRLLQCTIIVSANRKTFQAFLGSTSKAGFEKSSLLILLRNERSREPRFWPALRALWSDQEGQIRDPKNSLRKRWENKVVRDGAVYDQLAMAPIQGTAIAQAETATTRHLAFQCWKRCWTLFTLVRKSTTALCTTSFSRVAARGRKDSCK